MYKNVISASDGESHSRNGQEGGIAQSNTCFPTCMACMALSDSPSTGSRHLLRPEFQGQFFSGTWVGHHPVDEHLIGLFMGVSRVSQHGGPQNHPSHWFLKHEKTIENQWAGVASFSETSIYVNLLPQFHSNVCFNHETWIPRCMMFYSQFNDMECVCPKIGHRIDGKICSQPWDGRTQKMLALKREDLRFLLK